MGHGTRKVPAPDGKFVARIEDLVKKARKMADHFRQHNNFREWHVPPEFNDPLDVPSLHNPAWDRNNLNYTYSEVVLKQADSNKENVGTDGDVIALKWQIDFMAVEERAFRARHCSFVRAASLAHGRLDGHGDSGSLFNFLRDGVDTTLELGAQNFE